MTNIKKRGLKTRLFLVSLIPIIGIITFLFFSHSSFNQLGVQLDQSYQTISPKMLSLGELLAYRNGVAYFSWGALGNHSDKVAFDDFFDDLTSAKTKFFDSIKHFESIPGLPGEAEIYSAIKSKIPRIMELTDQIVKQIETNTEDSRKTAMSQLNGGEWHIEVTTLRKTVQKLIEFYRESGQAANQQQVALRSRTEKILWSTGILAILIMSFFLWRISFSLSEKFQAISQQLDDSGNQLRHAISQLSLSGQNLSTASSTTAASLEETVASLEEINSMTKNSAENAKQVATLSQESHTSAEKGEAEIRTLLDSMKEITEASKKIEEIINVIDDIAFQTNLLALNAAVEAARAGEQGKGFAVVAEAVRTLAQKSAEAAMDINQLIKSSVDKVERGSSIADKSGIVMQELVLSVKKVSELANEIATAAEEQRSGIEQIGKAMNSLDQGAQSNAASSEEIAANVEEISGQVSATHNLIGDLQTEVLGGSAAASYSAA